MATTDRLTWEPLRSVDTASSPFSTGAYTALGTPLVHPSYICKLVNNSNVLVTISITGAANSDVDVAPSNSFWLYDESKVGINAFYPALPAGTQIYIKSGTGGAGTGLVYLVTQYII
jgi:hypothetical protein